MQPDLERFILLPDTQIYAVGLMVWHLLLNSTSSWIHMKRTFFFSSAAGAVTASRGLYGKDGFLLLYKRLEIVSRHPIQEVHPQDLL